MNTQIIIEMVGYLGSLLVLVSFLMSSVVKLRIINSIGGLVFAIYALIIQSYPTAFMNFCLVGINVYYLIRMTKNDRHFDLIDGTADDAFLNYVLAYYGDDIKKYFPTWNKADLAKADAAYIVCCDAVPAGMLLGKAEDDGSLKVWLDYSTPTYRDCSVGKYLYSKLQTRGIHKLVFGEENSANHDEYLQKMGFVKEDGVYVKNLV